ncbi:XylR N-terminal domain-containing protein [Amorphus orientalis]|uniref:Hydrocarbon binding protein n=1 Tax=Amorphus orientalis TaxID=649198 RepID=A0AAE3VMR3_9HYPH|nr:XylR N-terminal domain-containing protein [Amorphus orientalis]MDQ0314974.1 putative hydrocarbon binding protein [Amorphus orientalis]
MQIDSDYREALDRGGQPTIAELLNHLAYNPLDATIKLAGARMVLQRAVQTTDLRDMLVRRHGEHEAMVVLMRLGYRAGVEDARFVKSNWPHIDVGDAFTAGTRLHMLSGVVRVETLSNDFDFKRDRYSSEFLWHGSAEAVEHHRLHGRAQAPVCWLQTGYAAGYASHFFSKLVIYRETKCAAMGHPSCHLIGGTLDRWKEDDPLVRLFQEEIITAPPARSPSAEPEAARATATASTRWEDLVVSAAAKRLETIAAARLPILISGPPGSGCDLAVDALLRWKSSLRAPTRVDCGSEDAAKLLRQDIGRRPGRREEIWILENLSSLPRALQAPLAKRLRLGPKSDVLIIALSDTLPNTPEMRACLTPEVLHGFSHVVMPPLSERTDVADIAEAMLDRLATDLEMPAPKLSRSAREALARPALSGNVPELAARLREALLSGDGHPIEADVFQPEEDAPFAGMRSGCVDVNALNREIYEAALEAEGGNVSAAARRVGLTRAQLAYRLKRQAPTERQ